MKTIKKIHFESEEDFLNELDGKVYAIANALGTKYLGDLLEDDFTRLWDKGYLLSYDWDIDDKIDAHQQKYLGQTMGNVSSVVLTDNKHLDKVNPYFVEIVITNKN